MINFCFNRQRRVHAVIVLFKLAFSMFHNPHTGSSRTIHNVQCTVHRFQHPFMWIQSTTVQQIIIVRSWNHRLMVAYRIATPVQDWLNVKPNFCLLCVTIAFRGDNNRYLSTKRGWFPELKLITSSLNYMETNLQNITLLSGGSSSKRNTTTGCSIGLMPNTCRRRDSTVELSCVGDVYTIRNWRVWTNLPTAKSSCVVSTVWTHPSAVVTQFTISCVIEILRLVTSDHIMTWLLKSYQSRSKFT